MSILEQIIKDMYIDPELLEQLGEEQKHILFRKIREEQVRRWEIKEKELEKISFKQSPRKINFLLGSDSKPWVWVMGEHKDDLPYDEIVHQRELKKQAEERHSELIEAENLAKKGILSLIKNFEDISVQRRSGIQISARESPEPGIIRTESQVDKLNEAVGPVQRRQLVKKASIIIGDTPEERQKFEEERVAEALGTIQRTKSIAKKRAEEMAKKLEDTWRESQRKANMYERSRKRSFKMAREMTAKTPNIHETILEEIPAERKREIVRKMSTVKKPVRAAPLPPKKRLLKMTSFVQKDSAPKSAAHVVNWFKKIESPKGVGKESNGSISLWFHGKIGRETAVRVLENEPFGSYLVRLSAKLWGYTVSVKTNEGSRHFLVDASSGLYTFIGPKQQKFKSLTGLLEYYKTNPVTWEGQELLLIPVGLEDDRDVYGELYSGDSEEEENDSSFL